MRKRGRGFACIHLGTNYHFGMKDESQVRLVVTEDARVEILTTMQELGQGTSTTLAMIVAEIFGGLNLTKILVPEADTTLPDGGYTASSRQTTMSGQAVLRAAEALRLVLEGVGSEILDADPSLLDWEAGAIVDRANPSRRVPWERLLKEARAMGIELSASGTYTAPPTTAIGEGEAADSLPINSFSYATAIADVEVDTETGEVRVVKLVSVHDSGTIINPLGAAAQVEGGLVMGLGFALTEDFVSHDCRPLTRGFTEYGIPAITDAPEIEVHFVESNPGMGPFGAKGLAEVPMVVAAPAIINAIADAVGVRIRDLPATPERIVRALRDSGAIEQGDSA